MKISPLLALLLLTASPIAAAPAANPVAAAVAAPDRPADQVELDASRKPVEVLTFLGLKAASSSSNHRPIWKTPRSRRAGRR